MYVAPSLGDISKALRTALRASIPATQPHIWPNNAYAVTKMVAGGLRGAYLRLEWLFKQVFASTAEGEILELHGSEIGIERLAAAVARGPILFTGTNGTAIAAGTRLVRVDGVIYELEQGATIAAGVAAVTARAVEAGAAGNADPGTPLPLEAPITGITAAEVGDDGMTGGAEAENDNSLRQRILHKKRNAPHGGSPAEYVGWTREHSTAITRIFTQRATPGPGSVTILFMMDDAYANGIPAAADVAALKAHLQSTAPENADINVTAPTPVAVNVTITDLVPDTPEVRTDIEDELKAMFRRRAEPGTANETFIFSKSWISEAIAMAANEERHILTAPAADVSCGENVIATLGTLTFA